MYIISWEGDVNEFSWLANCSGPGSGLATSTAFDSVHSKKCMRQSHICQKKNINASLCHMMWTNVEHLDHWQTLLSTTCGRHIDDNKTQGTWLLPKCLVWWMEFYSTNKHLRHVEQNELTAIVDARKRERPIRPGFVGNKPSKLNNHQHFKERSLKTDPQTYPSE